MANGHMKTCSTLLLEKCKLKLKWGITSHGSESLQIVNTGKGVDKREPSYTVGGNVNWFSHYGKMEVPQKTKNRTTISSSNPTPEHMST